MTVLLSGQIGLTKRILGLTPALEMWIRAAIKLPRPWCLSKTVGNSAGDFSDGGVRKNTDILDSDSNKISNVLLQMVKNPLHPYVKQLPYQ